LTDALKRRARARSAFDVIRYGRLGVERLVIPVHGLERAEKFAARGRDFPSRGIADYVTGAKDVDGLDPPRKSLDAVGPVRATRGEDDDISSE